MSGTVMTVLGHPDDTSRLTIDGPPRALVADPWAW